MKALYWKLANYRLPVAAKKLHKAKESTGLPGDWNEKQMWY